MKKVLLVGSMVLCLLLTGLASTVFAAWSVTTTWTASVGPNLAYEAVLLDATVQCTVTPPATTTCNFVVANLASQVVMIRSFNTQGAYADTSEVILQSTPAPATGIVVTITYVP